MLFLFLCWKCSSFFCINRTRGIQQDRATGLHEEGRGGQSTIEAGEPEELERIAEVEDPILLQPLDRHVIVDKKTDNSWTIFLECFLILHWLVIQTVLSYGFDSGISLSLLVILFVFLLRKYL